MHSTVQEYKRNNDSQLTLFLVRSSCSLCSPNSSMISVPICSVSAAMRWLRSILWLALFRASVPSRSNALWDCRCVWKDGEKWQMKLSLSRFILEIHLHRHFAIMTTSTIPMHGYIISTRITRNQGWHFSQSNTVWICKCCWKISPNKFRGFHFKLMKMFSWFVRLLFAFFVMLQRTDILQQKEGKKTHTQKKSYPTNAVWHNSSIIK